MYLTIVRFTTMLCKLIFGSCAEIPNIALNKETSYSQTLQISDKNGPISIHKSSAILEKLQQNGVDTNIFGRHLLLMIEITDNPLVLGNEVELLIDGPSTYDAMFKAIESARDHINVETYTFVGSHSFLFLSL